MPENRGAAAVAGRDPDAPAGFWRSALAGAEPGVDLPFDFPRRAGEAARRDRRVLDIGADLSHALNEAARTQQTDASGILFAAFVALLHRWTHQADIVCGARLESTTGTDVLPYRAFVDPTARFVDFLQSTRHSLREMSGHTLPLPAILELRGGSAPIFQVACEITARPGSAIEPRPDLDHCDLVLHVAASSSGLIATAEYDSKLFLPETIERLLRSFETLLQGVVAQPCALVGDLPVVSPDELRKLLVDWNATALPYEKELCIHEAFEKHVRQRPDAVAVVGDGERLTYAQLDAEAGRIALALREAGVRSETLVGIYLRRTPRLVAGILGILKAGGAYVPLDPNYPAERLRFIMEDTRMPVLVTEKALDASDVPAGTKVLLIDQPATTASSAGAVPSPDAAATAENLAYVIYTSGSTGKPKGVCLTHRVVMALAAWAQGLYTAEELAGVLFATSACFDVSVFECLVPLCLGGKIVVAPNILEVGALSARNEITLISGVPSAMAEVVRSGAMPRSVRAVNVAGEPCPQSLVDDLHALGHVRNVYDVYGPTETTVYSVGGPRLAGARPTIGKPLPNEHAYIVDARLKPVPQGVRGELLIGGEKLARGYFNRPDLTAEKFINLDWLGGERVYRTGDAARWLPDGTIEYLGRLDRQVKIRGFRVEPGEVEAVLRQHDDVAECAVVPRDDGAGAKILVAYVVGKTPAPNVDEMRAQLEQALPEYLVPTAFLALPKLPRSPNGKLDVKALPAPGATAERKKNYTPPSDGVEQQLVRVWEEVLRVKPVGVHDRFMDLGGHSLLAVRMMAEVEKKFGRRIPVSILFRAPTIAKLAKAIREEGLISARSCLVEIQPEGTKRPIFWLHTLGGGGGAGLFRYEKLARKLGADQPSYGLVAPMGEQPPTFEAMAEFYIREIRAVQATGPYTVGGYCFGGVLAFEVARQLEAAGQGAGTVIILDGLPPNPPGIPGFKSWTFVSHFARTLPKWLAARLQQPGDLTRRARGLVRRLLPRQIQPNKSATPAVATGWGGEEIEDFIDMSKYPAEYRALAQAHWRAMTTYRPKPFGGRIVLLKTYRPSLLKYEPEVQWRVLTKEVDVDIVPGSHSNMLEEPQVNAVAEKVARMLS